MNGMSRILQKFLKAEDGNVVLIAALMLPVVVGGVGLGVDLTRYLSARSQVMNAADQAALSAVAVDGQDRIAVARRFVELNLPDGVNGVTVKNVAVRDNSDSGGKIAVAVDVIADIDTTFGAILGLDKLTIDHTGEAMRLVRNVEVVMTLASGGTMCANKNRTPNTNQLVPGDVLIDLKPDASCSHFNTMKDGADKFVEIMHQNEAVANIKVGFVPYNYKVKMPRLNNIPPSIAKNEPQNFYSDVADAEPLSEVISLTSNLTAAKSAIQGLYQTPEGTAWTRSNLATHVAALMLDPSKTSYFKGEKPADFDDTTTEKVMILMTDGVNSGCCFTNWEEGNFDNQYVYFYKPDNDDQIGLCTALKEQGVRIFSILLDVREEDEGGREINNVFARCASGAYSETGVSEESDEKLKCSHKQNCYNVADDDELYRAYVDIAQTFYMPRLSQ
ncbi:MAG: pilus assembly protein TadG-related protein [Hyphomicrobiales bacterium]